MSRARYRIRRPTSVGLLSRGRDYSVRDLGATMAGYTKLTEKELGVSLDAEAPMTRWIQIHELAHVKYSLWSPKQLVKWATRAGKTLTVNSVLAAEDARINERALRAIPDAHVGFELTAPPEKLRRDLDGYVASHASPSVLADAIRPSINPAHAAEVDAALARLRTMPDRELSVLRVTVPLAELLERLKRAPSEPGDSKEPADEDGGGKPADRGMPEDKDSGGKPEALKDEPSDTPGEDGDEDEDADRDDADEEAEADGDEEGARGEADEPTEDEEGVPGALGEPSTEEETRCSGLLLTDAGADGMLTDAGADTPWIIPQVVEPLLAVPQRGGNRQTVSAETGSVLRWVHLHRIATDGVVFRRARRRPGALQRGTVLIDVSGSMGFSNAALEALVAMLPHATVAVYSGDGRQAWVVVVARNGRRVRSVADNSLVPSGGGNTCDGPALLWLSRQAAPRLWICDGGVTGKGDYPQKWMLDECAAIMHAAGIVQVCGKPLRATRQLKTRVTDFNPETLAPVLREVERGRV